MRSSAATTLVMLRRLLVLLAVVVALVGGLASPAMAHTELEPEEAVAGSTLVLTFHVAYEDKPTTGLEVQLPEGASVVSIPAKSGWTSSQDDAERTVSWTGGPVQQDEDFQVEIELPDTTGEVLFPSIQHTTEGDVAWISPDESEAEGTFPSPRMTLTADANASTTTTAPSTTTTDDLPGTTVEAANEGDGDSAAPWLIGAGIAAVVAIAVGGLLLKRHMDRAEARDAAGAAPDQRDGAPPGP